MKKSVKSNMYTVTLDGTAEIFAAHLDGRKDAPVCVLSFSELGELAREALKKSCLSLDYAAAPCVFAVIQTSDGETCAASDVLSMIEGLDPFRLIITDEKAAGLCSEAYHRPIPNLEILPLLERPTVAFPSLENILETKKGKQKAWKLLKKLLG